MTADTLFPALPVVLVDDERAWLRSLRLVLERSAGINNVICCSEAREALQLLAGRPAALMLLDLVMPAISGEQVLEEVVRDYPHIPVIVLTGMNQVEAAVRCIKLGAFDYLVKTAEEERLVTVVRHALRMAELQRENTDMRRRFLQDEVAHPEAFADLVTADKKMRSVFQYLEAVAPSSQPVLITGESGTGKELVARGLYRLSRPQQPWVAVNVAGLDDNVFSDTLFGHERGAFTGADRARAGLVEEARGGILFLDEIGDLSSPSQVKLLRLLQEGEYFPLGSDRPRRLKARVVVSTNRDLERAQAEGGFRRDLYYRLRTHHVHIPPLRERPGDIPLLLEHFLSEAARELDKRKPTAPPELSVLLANYDFPGNVRQLRAMVYDAVSIHQARKLSMDVFRRAMGTLNGSEQPPADAKGGGQLGFPEILPTLNQAISQLIDEALARTGGNQTIAADLLGISRPALNKRLSRRRTNDEPLQQSRKGCDKG
ncbi:MAG: sigma-54-dependent transcriptional regulator [Geoalkalibacter sp.]|uniref:sigma-54-dependent transcriptional regulator n=1 Tax=Geoalkalibacter sp. TaxID=3041440 RepID=UPI003D0CBF84